MNVSKTRTRLAISIVAMTIAGCGGGSGDGSGSTTSPGPGGQQSLVEIPGFDGIWTRECEITSSTASPFVNAQLVVSDTNTKMVLTETYFIDALCDEPAAIEEVVIESSLFVSGEKLPTDSGEAWHIDVTPESKTEDGMSVMLDSDSVRYDIVLVVDTEGPDELEFGFIDETNDGTTPELRPTMLDSDSANRYTR